jgi:hypothetical protein
LLKRRSTPETPVETPPEPARAGGKGRPTPKRSDAKAGRRAPTGKAPLDRKAAARARRDAARDERIAQRKALETGDVRNYPPLHQGKERALVRDIVDSRKSRAWIGMPGLLVLFVLIALSRVLKPLFGIVLFVELFLIFVVVWDSLVNYRRIGRILAERFPTGTKESTRALKFYGVQRNNTMPSRRRPPAQVQRGDQI